MASNYAQLVENYIKAAGSPVDLYAGTLGATGASTSLDWRLARVKASGSGLAKQHTL